MLTNREMMINLLLDQLENSGKEFKRFCTDDAGASEEAMVYYNIRCPYYGLQPVEWNGVFRSSEKWNSTPHTTTRYAGARRLLYKKLPFGLQ